MTIMATVNTRDGLHAYSDGVDRIRFNRDTGTVELRRDRGDGTSDLVAAFGFGVVNEIELEDGDALLAKLRRNVPAEPSGPRLVAEYASVT